MTSERPDRAGPLRNRWTVEDDTVLAWEAHFPAADRPAHVERMRRILRWGEELGVHLPDGPADPPLSDETRRAASRVAFADAAGAIVEDTVTDLGDVLAAAPFAAPVRHGPPLEVQAWDAAPDPGVVVSVGSRSDIWLPWCSARYETHARKDDLADNTALAARHTPRLNAFLARVGELAEEAGGQLALDRERTRRVYAFEVGDHGVLLDAQNPLERVTWDWIDGTAPGETADALHRALRIMSVAPPPPPFRAVLRVIVRNTGHRLHGADRAAVLEALRTAVRSGAGPAPEQLAGVATVEVDNGTGRHAFPVAEITG